MYIKESIYLTCAVSGTVSALLAAGVSSLRKSFASLKGSPTYTCLKTATYYVLPVLPHSGTFELWFSDT